ncbi:LLM class flavin-dependent oxidoreductase [Actinomadura yumaensis]|uniref:LLM class flavin-dependent oxidoreductase n=1 Tax=Actinomadura yumaensis TaxID=111807 RepID=UPI003615C9F9
MTDAMTKDDVGRVGIWTFAFDGRPAGLVREAAAEIEELGYGAIWFGEGFGRDSVSQAWLLLSATRRIPVAAGIANIAFRDPIAMAAAERALGEAFPGRYVLGLGGHRVDDTVRDFDGYPMPAVGRAVRSMTAYLDAMDRVPNHALAPDPAPRRVLAALGPKMLALAGSAPGARTRTSCPSSTPSGRGPPSGRTRSSASSRPSCSTPTPPAPARPRAPTSPGTRRRATNSRTCGGSASRRTSSRARRATGWWTRSSRTATWTCCASVCGGTSTPEPTTSACRCSRPIRPRCRAPSGASWPRPSSDRRGPLVARPDARPNARSPWAAR